ncbi:hypothetical protein BHM03_00053329 [Ensete ventricosum]|nr:hypothetical protein BHM03_00053329 [Ensete ventricosum]
MQGQPPTARSVARCRLRPLPACKGGRRHPQGAVDASGLQAVICKGCRQQGQRPPATSQYRGNACEGVARPLVARLPAGKATASCSGAAAVVAH